MKVCREDHWKPQSPVRKGGVVYSTDAPLLYIQPPEEEGNAETLFPEGCDRTSREDMQAEDREEWKFSEIPKKSRKMMEELELHIV